jgi:hypothetical protein
VHSGLPDLRLSLWQAGWHLRRLGLGRLEVGVAGEGGQAAGRRARKGRQMQTLLSCPQMHRGTEEQWIETCFI